MYLRFKCPSNNSRCGCDTWLIDYETDLKEHRLTCTKCGHIETLENIFKKGGGKRKNVIQKTGKAIESRRVDTSSTVASETHPTTQGNLKQVRDKEGLNKPTLSVDKKTMV